jgi:hypothetical protein
VMSMKRISLPLTLIFTAVPCGLLVANPASPDTRVKQFLAQETNGVSFKSAKALGRETVPVLLSRVKSRDETVDLARVVVALGILGDPSATPDLIDFLIEGQGAVSLNVYRGKSAVLTALAYLVNQTQGSDQRALYVIIDGLKEEYWKKRIHWSSPYHKDVSQLAVYLVRRSFQAAGVSGNIEARNAMLIHNCANKSNCPYRDVREVALKASDEVRELGLEAYLNASGAATVNKALKGHQRR